MTPATRRLLVLTLVGALAGVVGERIFGRVSTTAILVAAAVLAVPTVIFLKSPACPARISTSTAPWVIVIATITAAATVLARRALDGASMPTRLIVVAAIAAIAAGVVLRFRARDAAKAG